MTSNTSTLKQQPLFQISPSQALIGILGFLTLIGVVASLGRLFMGLRASTTLTDGYPWGIWIGFDFTLIAFAGTGFTIAAVVHVLHLKQFEPVARPAIMAGLMGYGAVLMLLVLDLGRPDRFYHFLIFWNVHSPLFEVSWCILLYTTVLAVEVSPCLFEKLKMEWPLQLAQKVMAPITIIGVTLSTLHQSTLGTLYLNMPHRLNTLWYTPILPLLFFVSSVMAGLAVAIIAYRFTMQIKKQPANPKIGQGLTAGIFWVSVLYLVIKVGEWLISGELAALFAFDQMSLLMLTELAVGVLIPIMLWIIPAVRRSTWGQWGIPLLVLTGVLLNRFNATMFAQATPPGVTYSPHILEWLSTIGIIAGAMLIWFLAVRFLAVCEEKELI